MPRLMPGQDFLIYYVKTKASLAYRACLCIRAKIYRVVGVRQSSRVLLGPREARVQVGVLAGLGIPPITNENFQRRTPSRCASVAFGLHVQ